MDHQFTKTILDKTESFFGDRSAEIYRNSILLKYLNVKTRSASRGSKSRSSFGSLYSIYTLIEDYVNNGFDKREGYGIYEGAAFVNLLKRARELPFGSKLQNHSFNNRTNHEFKKYFPTSNLQPIIHDSETRKYWFNEALLLVTVDGNQFNIARLVIEIIDEYIKAKQDSFERFILSCTKLQEIKGTHPKQIEDFILGLLALNVDARLFEIVSYSILKYYYVDTVLLWGYDFETMQKDNLKLFKTGRTNANDGGIDFVMKPLGRFFQVTETLDFKKYFLDIDKIQKYPITFVVKSTNSVDDIVSSIKKNAASIYPVQSVIDKYMDCIEEIINIPILTERFGVVISSGYIDEVLDEILLQSKIEFNFETINSENV